MPRFIRAPQAKTVPFSAARPQSAARPAEPMPLSGSRTPQSNFTPFSALGLGGRFLSGYDALNRLSSQGLNASTGLGGLGAGLGIAGGLAGALPGMNPQVSGSLQAAGSVGSLVGALYNPQTLQALRNFPSGGLFNPTTNPTGGGFSTGANLAGGALGAAGSIAGLAGAPPEASFALGTAGTLASGAGALAGAGVGAGAAAGAAGSGALAGGLGAAAGLAGLVYLPGAIAMFVDSINRADRAKFVQTNVGRVMQAYNETPAVQNLASNVDRLNAGDRGAASGVLEALESGVYAASRAHKNGSPWGITGALVARNREIGNVLDRMGMRGEAEAAARRGLAWFGGAAAEMLPRFSGLDWLGTWDPFHQGQPPSLGAPAPSPGPVGLTGVPGPVGTFNTPSDSSGGLRGIESPAGAFGLGGNQPVGQRPGPFGTYY